MTKERGTARIPGRGPAALPRQARSVEVLGPADLAELERILEERPELLPPLLDSLDAIARPRGGRW